MKIKKFYENYLNESSEYDSIDDFRERVMMDGLCYTILDSSDDNNETMYVFEDRELVDLLNDFIKITRKIENKINI